MNYEEKAEAYRAGAADPAGVKAALEAMEEFITRFHEAVLFAEPEEGRAIYRELVNGYLLEYCYRSDTH